MPEQEIFPIPSLITSRTLPHDEDAEKAVISSILISPKQSVPYCRRYLGKDVCFFNPANQEIFNVLMDLTKDDNFIIDEIVLANALFNKGILEKVGGRLYISDLAGLLPTAANIEKYVDIVFKHAVFRRLIQYSSSVMDRCYQSQEDLSSLLDSVEKEVLEIAKEKSLENSIFGMEELVRPAFDYLVQIGSNNRDMIGFDTGYPDLNKVISGLRGGEMIVIAARPSIGKTALALNLASNVALNTANENAGVGIFSLEMSKEMLAVRLLCSEARVSISDIKNNAIAQPRMIQLSQAAERLKSAKIYIDDTPGLDITEMRMKARRMHAEHGVRCIIIDYLQLLKADNGNKNASRENEVARISGGIKGIAKELNVPVIVLAQLNRQAEQGEKPKLSHLRESGAIEQDADIVMMLHRDRNYEVDPNNEKEYIDAELIVAKNRNGPTGTVEMIFIAKYTRYESKSRVSDNAVPLS